MDLDTIIYIILIAGSFLIPLLKKKKVVSQQPTQNEEVNEQDIFSILEKKFSEYDINTIIPTPDTEPLYDDYETNIIEETTSLPQYENYDFGIVKEEVNIPPVNYDDQYSKGNSSISEVNVQPMVISNTHDYEIKYNWDIEEDVDGFDFDPVKAVIYAEIMKRPAFS